MLKARKSIKRITKKELKEDKFITATVQGQKFLKDNARQITAGVLGVAALILLVTFFVNSKAAAESDAATQLTAAQTALGRGETENANNMLLDIIDRYDGTSASGQAVYQYALMKWDNSEYDLAKEYFGRFIDEYGSNKLLVHAAYAGYGDCLLHARDYAGAAEYYAKAGNVDPAAIRSASYFFSAALASYDGGDFENARRYAQKVVDNYDKAATDKSKAELLLAQLDVQK